MNEATVLVGHRYIVGVKEYAVLVLPDGEKRLGRMMGWADAIGLPTTAESARYAVVETGSGTADKQVILAEIPAGSHPSVSGSGRRSSNRR